MRIKKIVRPNYLEIVKSAINSLTEETVEKYINSVTGEIVFATSRGGEIPHAIGSGCKEVWERRVAEVPVSDDSYVLLAAWRQMSLVAGGWIVEAYGVNHKERKITKPMLSALGLKI